MDWEGIKGKRVIPPHVPKLMDPYDTQYFHKYPDSVEIEKKMKERVSFLGVSPIHLDNNDDSQLFNDF